MTEINHVIRPEPPQYSFDARTKPLARADLGERMRFITTDRSYDGLTGEAIDRNLVNFQQINEVTGPVFVNGIAPGDSVGIAIIDIAIADRAWLPYVARWRSQSFDQTQSFVQQFRIADGLIDIGPERGLPVRPSIGCIGLAPAQGVLSALSPCGPTGGNLDLPQLTNGATIWIRAELEGGLISLGDLHARVGTGEAVGAGFECAGQVDVEFHRRTTHPGQGPYLEDSHQIAFIGSHPSSEGEAEQIAVGAAVAWLLQEFGIGAELAITLCAGLLNLSLGGPAGANVLAAFHFEDLAAVGLRLLDSSQS